MVRNLCDSKFGGLVVSPLLLWLALPGRFYIWPLLLICLVPLFFWIFGAENSRNALIRGVLAGIVFHVLQLYWIISVLTTFGGLPIVLALPALLLLALYMGLYLGLFSLGFYLLAGNTPYRLLLIIVPALWVGLDWVRSWLFGGFPWLDLGYGFWSVPAVLQVADLFGHYSYTFFIVLMNLVVFTLVSGRFNRYQKRFGTIAIAVLIVFFSVYSWWRWLDVERKIDHARTAVIGIVQGNIEQGRKWSPAERENTVKKYIKLSEKLDKESLTLIVWPETALPFYPRNNDLLVPVKNFVKQDEVTLLTGAPWYEISDWDTRNINYYNSALLLSESGDFAGSYFKSHLVPYGEYVPLKKYLPFLAPLVESVGDFTPGEVENPITAGDIKAGILICYESIFASIGRAWVNSGANLLVNLTNDAWYGKSSAPYQSWAMTIFRTIENRRSLIRSANTGISGAIDPLGRIKTESDLFVEWSQVVEVPLLTQKTFFNRGGFLFAPLCAGVALLSCLLGAIRARRKKQEE